MNFPRWLQSALLRILLLFQTILSKIAYFLGPVCVIIAFGLIFGITFVFFSIVLPHYVTMNYFGLLSIFHIFLSLWLAFNLPFNYFMCISTSPGRVTTAPVDPDTLTEDEYEFDYCKICDAMKPERSHHCTVCGKCTLRMDHHCPWMANCVGHFNYKYFILFLFYMTVSCFYVATLCGIPVTYGGLPAKLTIPLFGRGGIEFILLLCSSVGLAVGGMLLWHLFLVATQQTTIEFYQNQMMKHTARSDGKKWVNIYDRGLHNNFDSVFGSNSLYFRWLLPSTRATPGDGQNFLIRDDVILRHPRPNPKQTLKGASSVLHNV